MVALELLVEDLCGLLPRISDRGRHREPVLCQLNRSCHRPTQGQAAKAPGQRRPRCRCARHSDGQRPVFGDFSQALGGDFLKRHALRRSAAGVQAMQLALVPDQRKGVAANTVGAGLHHCQGGGGNGVAARLQDLQAGLCRQRLLGGDHAAFGINHIAAGGVGVIECVEGEHG